MRVRDKCNVRADFNIESKIAALLYQLRVFFRQRELSRAPIFFYDAARADIMNPRVWISQQRVNRFDEQTLRVRGAEFHEETRKQVDTEIGRQGNRETRKQGINETGTCLLVYLLTCYLPTCLLA